MSLYNDERPQKFVEILGQSLTIRQIKRKIAEERFPHTALLTGPRGTGKTTCAGIIGKALNCDNPGDDGEPCCQCESCQNIKAGLSPTVLELDAATHNGVEDVRALIEQSQFVPAGKKKVFILDEVHMFSTAAWNALLKTLEEPPENVVFIMATTELQKVPLTVLSRSLKFEFHKIGREVMQNYILGLCAKYKIGIEPDALSLVVTSAEGCMRDALSLLEQFIGCDVLEAETLREFLGIASEEIIFDMLESMKDGDEGKTLHIVEECEMRGKNMVLVVKAILEALTYATAYKAGAKLPALSDVYYSRLKRFSESVSESKIEQFCGIFLQVYPLLAKNAQLSFFLKAAIINLVSSESLLYQLERDVSYLKKGVQSVGQVVEVAPAVENIPDEITLSETNGGDEDLYTLETSFPGDQDNAGYVKERETSDESGFEVVPDLGDYYEEGQDNDSSQESEVFYNAGQETPQENDVSGLQNGQVMDVDEFFRIVDETRDNTAKENVSTGEIVMIESKEKEEPVDQGYVAEGEDEFFAAFDYYMAGGSARR